MGTSLIDSDSLLAIDIGAVNTRATLFDVVDGRYRFIGMGMAPTTVGAPFFEAGEGVRRALDQLKQTTGRELIDADEQMIIPARPDGTGVDTCVATISAGPPLKVVAVGLLDDISTESAVRLASTTYAQVVEKLNLLDRRKTSSRLDAILRTRPDLVIVAGGTEGGAFRSVEAMLEPVGLACYLLPEGERPEILYAGNSSLADEAEKTIGPLAHLSVAPNIRPAIEMEQLTPAQKQLSRLYRSIRCKQIPGVSELDAWTKGSTLPTAAAFGRIVRFLSKVYDPAKGVLGIDIGASAATIAASLSGDLSLGVYTDLGLGPNLPTLLKISKMEDIKRWLPMDMPESDIRDYIYNKAIHPQAIPASKEELAVELALARRVMQIALRRILRRLPKRNAITGSMPYFEPILAAGSVLTNAPSFGQAMLAILDGIQPTGVTTVVLDLNNISGSLGAAAEVNPILPVHILESNTFLNLGTVVSPVGNAQMGSSVMRIRVSGEGDKETTVEVKYGTIEILPLPLGKSATLHFQPAGRFDVGMGGPGRGGSVRVAGGALGVVIDGRGRPIRLPSDDDKRYEAMTKWLWTFGS